MYKPEPIDTSDVVLDGDMLELLEVLAKQVHDVWSLGRINDGWTYGPMRDDGKKETPCLVPYCDLPEEEKSYDRSTALNTLKLILKLGYKIERR